MDTEYPKVYLYRRIVASKLFIDSHFEETINLDNIASEASFSKFHFIRLFKKIYGESPHQYLISVRVEKARFLLSSGASAAEACHRVGFDSVSSFTNLFKRVTGQTPAQYQSAQASRLAAIQTNPLGYIPGCFAEKKGWKAE